MGIKSRSGALAPAIKALAILAISPVLLTFVGVACGTSNPPAGYQIHSWFPTEGYCFGCDYAPSDYEKQLAQAQSDVLSSNPRVLETSLEPVTRPAVSKPISLTATVHSEEITGLNSALTKRKTAFRCTSDLQLILHHSSDVRVTEPDTQRITVPTTGVGYVTWIVTPTIPEREQLIITIGCFLHLGGGVAASSPINAPEASDALIATGPTLNAPDASNPVTPAKCAIDLDVGLTSAYVGQQTSNMIGPIGGAAGAAVGVSGLVIGALAWFKRRRRRSPVGFQPPKGSPRS